MDFFSTGLKTDYSALFGNLSATGNNQTSGISLSDYAMIKNGTYKKLMKSYYAMDDNEAVKSIVGKTVASKDSSTEIQKLQSSAADLDKSAKALYSDEGAALFEKGKEADLLKAVKGFVKNYNSLVDVAGDSENDKVLRAGSNMLNNAVASYKMLDSIGIRVGMDNKLSIDEDKFNDANATTKKSVLNGVGSFAYKASTSASYIGNYAKNDAATASGMYGAGGAYNSVNGASSYDSFM